MPAERKVGILVGSLRKESFNRKLALAATALAPDNLKFEMVEIGNLPLYNQDEEAQPHASWAAFRDKIRTYDALLFVTPEYNRGPSAAIKNAIDVGSRPPGKNVFDGKPAAIMSSSPGAMGGYGANHGLRPSIAVLNMPVMPTPEIYIPGINNLIDAQGQITADATRDLLKRFMTSFAAWIEANVKK